MLETSERNQEELWGIMLQQDIFQSLMMWFQHHWKWIFKVKLLVFDLMHRSGRLLLSKKLSSTNDACKLCRDNWTCPIFTKNTGIYRYILFKLFTALLVESHVANVSMNKYRLLFGDDDGDITYIKKKKHHVWWHTHCFMNEFHSLHRSVCRKERKKN